MPHDVRYRYADEYLDVLYKLWEGSWDDDAVVADREAGVFTDPSKVRYIDHVGERHRVAGPHIVHPSRQRTPVLFQATGSPAGIEFAGRHAEVVFTGGRTSEDGDHAAPAQAPWSVGKAAGVLLGATVLVAWVSEFLVGAVEAAQHSLGVTETFVGVIIVAVVGNAAEHSTAVTMALKNKMDLALGIAVGSSLQIALFVAPVLVFSSYLFPHQLSLEFTIPEVVAVVIAAFVTDQISRDGKSNWLEGVQLLALYAILAVLFYFLPATR